MLVHVRVRASQLPVKPGGTTQKWKGDAMEWMTAISSVISSFAAVGTLVWTIYKDSADRGPRGRHRK